MATEDLDRGLCQEVLDVLERGVNIIRTDYHSASLEAKEAIIEGTQALLETCVGLEPLLSVPEDGATIIREFQTLLIRMLESYEQQLRLKAPRVSKGPGRPAFEIPEAQLRFLFDNNFKATEVAEMFSCSVRTIQRRMKEFNLASNVYSYIDDEVLDEVVRDIAARLPSCGIRSIQSMLRADGLSVQIRDS